MKTTELKDRITGLQAVRKTKISDLNRAKNDLKLLKVVQIDSERALHIIQINSKKTQEQLEYRISELVSLSLAAVFENPYKLKLIYDIKRNKTEASLVFERDGKIIDPLDGGGHGAVDIAGFALKASLWSLKRNKLDNVLIYDEPLKNLNDSTRRLHRNAALMIKEVSKKLGLQLIITSQIPELQDIADKVFEVKQKKGVSYVEEI